ncbi:tetratricopeptide repeat protein [Candidatus Uabimicrobium amorphum]|uniref:Tetratricopeptide repeat protein n=1 Tax=Uabimicrobium amorphum TaxID=2596890 RepID=A0A5S9IU06_UABAM|nr:tetratricopeptide repeat protein [Candidatus Uabimicrobium amorphum]BBM88128.1 hypothetical protein UABAM_06544 [Candidatus Uabimicrobium amorphum]
MIRGEELEKAWAEFQDSPQNEEQFAVLKESFLGVGDWKKLVELYSLHVGFVEKRDPELGAKLYGERASIEEKYLSRSENAFASYQKSYALQKQNNPYMSSFILLCKSMKNWEVLCNIWEEQLQNSKSDNEKISLLQQLATCHLQEIKNREKAKEIFRRIVDEFPHNEEAFEKLELLYLEDDDYEKLIAMYRQQIQSSSENDIKLKRLQQVASMCEQLQKTDEAIKFYMEILSLQPQQEYALNALESIYTEKQDWQAVLGIMRKKSQSLSEPQLYDYLISMADIAENKLGDNELCVSFLEGAVAKEDFAILTRLEKHYSTLQNWQKLAGVYQKQIELASERKKKREVYFALAKLHEEHNSKSDAIACLYKALEDFPKDKEILERLKSMQSDDEDGLLDIYRLEVNWLQDPAKKVDLWGKMGQILQGKERWNEAIAVYEDILKLDDENLHAYEELQKICAEEDQKEKLLQILVKKSKLVRGEERVEVFNEIAELCTLLRKEDEAIVYYQKIKQLQPNNRKVLYLLADYYREKQEHKQLVAILQQIVNVDKSMYEHGYMEMAEIYENHLNNIDIACKSYEKIIQAVPDNLEAYRRLRSLYKRNNKKAEYLQITSKLASITPKFKEKLDLLFSLCDFYKERDLVSKLEEQLKNVLEVDSHNSRAVESLKALYEKKQDWKKLIAVLQKQSQMCSEIEDVIDIYYKIATFYQEKLRDADQAVLYFEKIKALKPDYVDVLRKLEVLYTQLEAFEKLVKILQQNSYLSVEVSQRVNYIFMAGMILEEKLKEPQRAMWAYENVILNDPYHINALVRLKKLYKGAGDVDKLEAIYEKLSVVTTDNNKLIELYLDAAQICDNKALYYQKIVELDAKNKEALEQLASFYQSDENWEKLIDIRKKQLEICSEKPKIIEYHTHLAHIYKEHVDSPSQAAVHYERILHSDNKNKQAIENLLQIHSENWEKLLGILQLKMRICPEERREILLKIANIYHRKTMQLNEAIKVYNDVLAIDENDRRILEILRNLYGDIEEYPKALQIVNRELKLDISHELKVELLLKKANLAQHHINQPTMAASTLEELLQVDPMHEEAFYRLESLYHKREEYDKLLKVLHNRCEVDEKRRLSLKLNQAYICEKTEKWDEAITTYKEILQLNDKHEEAKKALVSILRTQKKWELLIEFFEEELQKNTDYKAMTDLYNNLGNIWSEQLNKCDEALEMYQQVLELDSSNLLAIRGLQAIYARQKNTEALLKMYIQELEVESIERERRIWLYLMCGDTYEFVLHDWDQAHESYIKVLYNELDPNNLIALRGLQRVYRAQKKYSELQVMLLREFQLQTEDARALQLHLEIAKLKERYLKDPEGSIEYYRVVHEAWPNDIFIINSLETLLHGQKMWNEYVAILEKKIELTKRYKNVLEVHESAMKTYGNYLREWQKAVDHGLAILEIDEGYLPTIQYLQKMYKKMEEEESFAAMCVKEANLIYEIGDRKRICGLYLEAGKIYALLDKKEDAIFCFERILNVNPSHSKALMNLIQIYSATGNWERLINVYEWTAQVSEHEEEVVNLHLKIAYTWEDKLQDNLKALPHYQYAYSKNSQNLAVVKGLRTLYEKMKRWPEAAAMLLEESELEAEEKKAKIFFRLGEIWEKKLNSPIQARDNYLKVIGYGFHRKTSETLVEIQEKLNDYEGMTKILEEDARKCEPQERLNKYLQLGKIYWYKLHKADEAIRTYSKVLKVDSQHPETLKVMAEISKYRKDWKMYIGILNRQTRNTQDPEELYNLCVQLGEVFHEHLGEGNRAIDFYEQALVYKEDLQTIRKLQYVYEEWGCYKKLVDSILSIIDRANGHEKIALYHKLGHIYGERIFDDNSAIGAYENILDIEDDIDACYALAKIYKRQYIWDKLIGIYDKLIADAKLRMDTEEQLKVQLDAAQTYYYYLEDYDKAYNLFKSCLELSPSNDKAFDLLEEILEKRQQYKELANLLTNKMNITEDEQQKITVLHRLANVYIDKLQQPENAVHYYEKILQISETEILALEKLEGLYSQEQNIEALMNVYNLKLKAVEDPAVVSDTYYKLACVYLENYQDTEQATAHLRMSLNEDPGHIDSIKLLADILVEEQNWEQAIDYIQAALGTTKNPQEKYSLLTKVASIYKSSINDLSKAKGYYLQALDIQPKSIEPLSEVIAIYSADEKWKEAEILLERLISVLPEEETDKIVEAYYDWGVAAQKQKKIDQAIGYFKSAVEKNNEHLPSVLSLAKIYFSKQSFHESLTYYEKAYSLESEETNINIIHQSAILHKILGNIDKAIEFYQMLLDRKFSRLETLKSLSSLYSLKKEWDRALLYQQQVVNESPEGEESVAYEEMGDIYKELDNLDKSIDYYLKAIENGKSDIKLKKKLVALYIRQKDWEAARNYNDLCFSELQEAEDKEENRNLHARILIGLGQKREAVHCYQETLKVNPICIKAIKGIAEIYLAEENWSALSNSYREFLTNLPEDKKENGLPIHLALGFLYLEKIQKDDLAIEQFEAVLQLDHDHTEALIALTKIKTKEPASQEEAIKGHFRILKKDSLRVDSYLSLHDLLEKTDKKNRAMKCYRAYQYLSNEKVEVSSKLVPVNNDLISSFIIPKPIQEVREVISTIEDYCEKIYQTNIEEKFDIKKREHLGAERVQRPIWYHTHSIMKAMGIRDLNMYITAKHRNKIFLENTNPPSLIICKNLVDNLSEQYLRFLIAKYLFYVSLKQILVQKLEMHELHEHWKMIYSCFGKNMFDSAEFGVDQKKLRNLIPRKTRKSLEAKEDFWQKFINCDIEQYVRFMDYASNRCAFTVIDSLETSINTIYFWEMGVHVKNKLEELRDMATVHDLLLYNISESYEQVLKQD